MSFARERERAARQAREELPEQLRKGFELYDDASGASGTDDFKTAFLRTGLLDSTFFGASPALLRGPGSFRYLRVAGVFLIVSMLVQAWFASPSRRQIFAMVKEMQGGLVLHRGGRSFTTQKLEKIQSGDRLQAGTEGCSLRLSKGRALSLPPNASVQCIALPGEGVLALQVSSGTVELEAGSEALIFLAGGRSYLLTGRCKLVQKSCCVNGKRDALELLLYQGSRVSWREPQLGKQGASKRGAGKRGNQTGPAPYDIRCNGDALEPFSGWLDCCQACRK